MSNSTKLNFFMARPVKFKGICSVYPPTINQVIDEENFNLYLKLLTLTQEEIEDEFTKDKKDFNDLLNPFEYLFNIAIYDESLKQMIVNAFLFFTREPVFFLYEQKRLIIGDLTKINGDLQNLRFINEDDYFEFQNLIRESVGEKVIEKPEKSLNPKIARMRALARYRDKVKAKQGGGANIVTILTSLCFMDCGISPLNIGELSYMAVQLLMQRYQEKEKYDLDTRQILAGADPKKVKPTYWIKNLE